MTDQEKQMLKSELMKEILAEIHKKEIKDSSQTTLKIARNKWFRTTEKYGDSTMQTVFNSNSKLYSAYKIWEAVSKLTCNICSEKYVRNLRDTDFANYAADKLCQTIYDLRVEFNEKYGKEGE